MNGVWTLALDGSTLPDRGLIGGKAWSVARMRALGLPVPPAFVVTTRACSAYLAHGHLPDGLDADLDAGIAGLEAATGRRFGAGPRPLLVSVRSGAPVSMPGMMDTILNLGMTEATEAALAAEAGDAAFARDTHRRFLDLYAQIVLRAGGLHLEPGGNPAAWRAAIGIVAGEAPPGEARAQLRAAVRAVFESWNGRRARRYREHHGIPHDLGTAVTVQAMVFGNLDAASGTGVLFSRNPLTGAAEPYGEYLPRAQGEDVVSGRFTPLPLAAMAAALPGPHGTLIRAAAILERASRDAQDIEFTVERGQLWLLQARAAKRAPEAAVRMAVEMAEEGLIDRAEALDRVSAEQVRMLLRPRLVPGAAAAATVVAEGEGASPGVGAGRVVTDADAAEAAARAGEAVVLVRPTTSPEDVHGMIAAKAIVTEAGGATSHAAVVSRALGLPCVTGCGVGTLAVLAGAEVTVDGTAGRVWRGRLAVEVPEETADPRLRTLAGWAAAAAPVRVVAPEAAPPGTRDLDRMAGGEEPERLPALLAGVAAATGGALRSDAGVRAALRAGVQVIAARPALPVLLAAIQAGRAPGSPEADAVAAED
jgi:pyruvate,orthophosphate dikinase